MGIPESELKNRIMKTSELMKEHSIDLLFGTSGANFYYLSGVESMRSERLVCLVISKQETPLLICPTFELETMRHGEVVCRLIDWKENENPYEILKKEVKHFSSIKKIGVEPTTWFKDFQRLKAVFPDAVFVDCSFILDEMRAVKTEYEVGATKKAVVLVEEIINELARSLRAGVTEKQVYGQFLSNVLISGYRGDGLIQFGENSAIPHNSPGDKTLKAGEIVLFDCTVLYEGYHSDITRTFCFGTATDRMKSVYAVVYEAQQQAIKCVKRGVNCGDVDTMARNHIEQNGYGTYFTHRVGHGLGLDIHESPYLVETNPKPLVSGNIITVEPGIYFPGDFGIRIEENVLVTDDGCEVLSSRAPSLVELYA